MSITRRQRSTWTTVDNRIINDRKLAMKALGLLVFMLSKPDNWVFSQESLGEWFGEGREAMRSVMKNLSEAGYIQREVVRTANGQLRTTTIVCEEPDTGFPTPAEPTPAEPSGGSTAPLVKTDAVKTDPVKTEEGSAPLPEVPVGYKESLKMLISEGVEPQPAADWLKVRAKHKAPLTDTAWDAVKREAGKAGVTLAVAVKKAAEKSWRGFEAEWWFREQARGNGTFRPSAGSTAGMNYKEGYGPNGEIL